MAIKHTLTRTVVLGFNAWREFILPDLPRTNSRGKRVLYLEYEAYAEMAVRQMQKIAAEMKARWEVLHVSMVHRTGRLEVGEVRLAGQETERYVKRVGDVLFRFAVLRQSGQVAHAMGE